MGDDVCVCCLVIPYINMIEDITCFTTEIFALSFLEPSVR